MTDTTTNLQSFAQSEDAMKNKKVTIISGDMALMLAVPQGMMPFINFTSNAPFSIVSTPVTQEAEFEDVEEDVVYDIPEELQSAEARALLDRAQVAGYLDYDWQPVSSLSRTQMAMLADFITETLHIQRKWAVMEKLWSTKNLRQAYDRALCQTQYINIKEEIENLLKER